MKKLNEIVTAVLNSFLGIILFVVSLAAFYLPYEIRIIPEVARVLPVVRYVCAGALLLAFFLLYISTLRVFRDNWALWAGTGFVLILIFSTVMNSGDMESAMGTHGLAGVFLLMDLAVFFRVNPKRYILLAFFFFLIINIANTYTVFEYCLRRGDGMWETYGMYRNSFYSLVGNYNGGIEYVLPMAICGSAYAMRYGKWLEIFNYAAMIMSLIMAVSCESLTQIIAFAAILGFMLLGDIAMLSEGFAKVLRIVFQPVIFVAVDLVVFVSVIVLNRSNWVARIGLDPDFHNRRHVWNMSMDWIAANPIWGNGQETVGVEASKITGYAHSHCTYLEVAYKTGFMGSVMIILMLAAAVTAIYRNRHSRTSYILTAMLFLFGLAAVAETYPMVYVLLCLGLVYYIAKTTNETQSVQKRMKQMRPERAAGSRTPVPPGGPQMPSAGSGMQGQSAGPGTSAQTGRVQMPTQPNAPRRRDPHVKPNRQKQQERPMQPASAYEIQEDQLEHVGQRVQMVQSEDIQDLRDNMDETVHIDETVMYRAMDQNRILPGQEGPESEDRT